MVQASFFLSFSKRFCEENLQKTVYVLSKELLKRDEAGMEWGTDGVEKGGKMQEIKKKELRKKRLMAVVEKLVGRDWETEEMLTQS